MFTGMDFFGLDGFSENMLCVNNIYDVKLENSVVDQVSIRTKTDVAYSDEKETIWNYDEILLADFLGDLEAGDIHSHGNPIISLRFMKKKTTDLTWEEIITIPYKNTVNKYQFKDFYIAGNVSYDYAMIGIGVGGVQSDWVISTIVPSFVGTFLLDDNKNFHLSNNLKWDAITTNISMGKYEPMNAQYPITIYGSTKYKSGKVTNTLITDNSLDGLGNGISGIDLAQERLQADAFMNFITNYGCKILKDGQGKILCVNINGNPTEVPNNDIFGGISDVTFDFIEICGTDIASLAKVNLGNIIPNN